MKGRVVQRVNDEKSTQRHCVGKTYNINNILHIIRVLGYTPIKRSHRHLIVFSAITTCNIISVNCSS